MEQTLLTNYERFVTLGRLLGDTTHEFSNLICIIAGYVKLLEKSLAVDDPRYVFAKNIGLAVTDAQSLTQQLLLMARGASVTHATYNIAASLRELDQFLQPIFSGRLLFQHIEPAPQLLITGDAMRLRQALINLILNAFDASPIEQSVQVQCSLRLRADLASVWHRPDQVPDCCMVIAIHDQGHGIAASLQQTMFEPYVSSKVLGAGCGLGLALVKACIDDHGGMITCESQPDHGTSFYVYLPVLSAA